MHTLKLQRNGAKVILIHNSDFSGTVTVRLLNNIGSKDWELEIPGWIFQEVAAKMIEDTIVTMIEDGSLVRSFRNAFRKIS